MRIVSLVPSITELLHALGLEQEVVGITKFCVHPQEWFRTKTRVGGTKTLHLGIIRSLQPDLIIANKEENIKEQIEELATQFNMLVTDVNNYEDALAMIAQTGTITGKEEVASRLITKIKEQFSTLPDKPLQTAVYLIWTNPWMTVGGDTFIHLMMQKAGLQNIFSHKTRYPITTLEEIASLNPQWILLSSEPYPFKQKHIAIIQDQLPAAKIMLVDGEMFSWYGSRMLYAANYFKRVFT